MFRRLGLAMVIGSIACGSSGANETGGTGGASGGNGGASASGGSGGVSASGGIGGTGVTGGSGGTIVIPTGGAGGTSPIDDSGAGGSGFSTDGGLPPGFTMTDKGGYRVGDAIPTDGGAWDAGTPSGSGRCNATLIGIVRDQKDSHRDFERLCCGDTRGALMTTIGSDQKPIYAGTGPTNGTGGGTELMSGPAEFESWYRNVDGVNAPYVIYLFFVPGTGGVFTFHSSSFFPLDGKGFGNQNRNHNFHFTTELHTQFKYAGGETFHFTGDDDVWVYINGKLAIDLGGVHGAEDAEVNLDAKATELAIERGKVYPLDLFHAERHTSESNFRVETNLDFVNCGIIIPK